MSAIRVLRVLALLTIGACSEAATAPDDRVPRLGRYSYTSSSSSRTGTLTITQASASAITGTWAMTNTDPATSGTWTDGPTGDGYLLPSATYTLVNGQKVYTVGDTRYVRKTAAGMECVAIFPASTGVTFDQCTLTYIGP